MNDLKTPVSRLLRVLRDARDRWKAKALERQKRLRAAQVPVRDGASSPSPTFGVEGVLASRV